MWDQAEAVAEQPTVAPMRVGEMLAGMPGASDRTDGTEAAAPKSGQRQQPKGKKRSKAAMTKPSAVQENVPDTDNPTT